MSYQLTRNGFIQLRLDEATVLQLPPEDNGTPEWRAYLRWLEEGNTPLPADEAERARNADGTFIGDDPATPGVNEAWVDGGQE